MLVKRIIEFGCDLAELGKITPRNACEVVVLVMISNVVSDFVDGTIVRVRFLQRADRPVFCYPSDTTWVKSKTYSKDTREQQKQEGVVGEASVDEINIAEVEYPVEKES